MDKALVLALSFGVLATAIIVVALAALVCVRRVRTHRLDEVFWFAVALIVGWGATLHFRWAYITGAYDWINRTYLMQGNDFDSSVHIGLAAVIVSGLLHVRALTLRADEALWRWMSLLVFAVPLGVLWLVQ